MEPSRHYDIEDLAGKGQLETLKALLGNTYTKLELDIALCNAVAYGQLKTADYLLSLGGDFARYDYEGIYYAVHNNELAGLQYALSKGVDVNLKDGLLLNTAITTAINTQNITIVAYLLANGADVSLLTPDSLHAVSRYGSKALKKALQLL